ncbi:TonB-dependent receptor [Altererythrobacter sp.]|uniref:TonB-dependent receptor n=1 Tax=Altererythrobacter sp. TaxID=1872480 RepID=UPI003D054AC3
MIRELKGSVALGVLAFASLPAFAQDQQTPAADDGSIHDIVVTAQRRSESVQKTALSIEVFSGDTLSERGIARPDDLTKLATGLQVGGGTTTQVYIRGVGDFGVTATANPAVVTSLNGVAIARPQAISGNFFDLERVEVLKGPQGTLYGRNASGGALNLIAAKPRIGEFSGYFNGTIGNYETFAGEGAVNVPMTDVGALRLAYQLSDRDGYLTDGGDDDKHQSVRLQGLLEPNDAMTLRLGAGYTHLGGNGSGLAVIPRIPGQSAWTGSTSTAAADYHTALATAIFMASGGTSVPPALLDRPDAFDLHQNVQSWNVDAQLDYDFGGATLTVIPAYRRTTAKFSIQPSFNYSLGDGTDGETSDQYSLEARLGHTGDKLKWVVGAFAFKEDQSTDFAVNSGLIQRIRVASDLSTKSYAAFGEATYSIIDALRLIAGLRYTSDRREQTDFRKFAISPTVTGQPPLAIPCLPPAFLPGEQCSLLPPGSFDTSKTFKKATWKAGFEADLTPQSMLFGTVSTGFKAGGFNQAIDPANPAQTLAFAPETITAYTVGLRNRLLDNKLQLNVEGFYWDYKDLQLTSLLLDGSGNISLATQNAGKARLYGFNADVIAKPARNTTLRAALEYVNSKYKDFSYVQAAAFTPPGSTGCAVTPSSLAPGPLGPFVNIDCSGFRLVRSPKWSGSVGLAQIIDLNNGGNFTFDTDLAFASSRYTSTSFIANSKVASYTNWSASLTYNAPGDRWFLGAYVRNITNAKIYTGGGGDQSPFVTGFITSSIGAPRTWGGRFGVRF